MSFKETFRIYYTLARFTRGPISSWVYALIQASVDTWRAA